jgi:leucyl aminopeptidase
VLYARPAPAARKEQKGEGKKDDRRAGAKRRSDGTGCHIFHAGHGAFDDITTLKCLSTRQSCKLPHPPDRIVSVTSDLILPASAAGALPLWLVPESAVDAWLAQQPSTTTQWVRANQFAGERHRVLVLPGADGNARGALVGLGSPGDTDLLNLWHTAPLAERLPAAAWRIVTPLTARAATQAALGWLTGAYRFLRYRNAPPAGHAMLEAPAGADVAYASAAAQAMALARDLINTPANDLGPAELALAATRVAKQHDAAIDVVEGEALARGYPMIHAVGRASARAPRLIDLTWGDADAPRVTLVGKGVCFDSGGLDLKPSAGMLLMKKDMGGAACVLALADLLMRAKAPIRLRVLVPAVENAVDGSAYRPGDVLRSRKGLSVEVGNTDAEGRLVLADALAEADGGGADLLIDLATLTGAARTALGPELPAAYSNDGALLGELQREAEAEHDPVWPMPLWGGYDEDLASKVADLGNVATHGFAGSIIGALFLRRFVTASPRWIHIDLYAWNARERPGRPVGAEAQCVRALYRLIRARCG